MAVLLYNDDALYSPTPSSGVLWYTVDPLLDEFIPGRYLFTPPGTRILPILGNTAVVDMEEEWALEGDAINLHIGRGQDVNCAALIADVCNADIVFCYMFA